MSKLTAKERKWLDRLQELLDKCPSERLGFYTVGDDFILVYDRTYEDDINDIMDGSTKDFCMCVADVDADLDYSLRFPAPVHSTSG